MSDENHNHLRKDASVATVEGKLLSEGRGGGGGGTSIEGIAFFLLLVFMTRIIGDVINRVRTGRSLKRSLPDSEMLEWPRIDSVKNEDSVELMSRQVRRALEAKEHVVKP